ncbi:MAG: hypothetical protein WBX77_20780, partial [Pseudolabrys sp.]
RLKTSHQLPELRQPPSDFLIFSNAFDGPDLYGESNAELAAISAGERGVSGSAFASRTGVYHVCLF